jgi:single-strand DNA-binding protein
MLNKACIIGRLGQDPEIRYLTDGTAVCNVSVATSESWKDKATGEKKEATEWHRISVFGRLAEICGEYLKKGGLVYFEGKLKTRKWTDKDGTERYTTEIHASEMKMLSAKDSGGGDHGDEGEQRRPTGRPQGPTDRPTDRPTGPQGASNGRAAPPARNPAGRQQQPTSGTGFDDMDDDIPF